MPLYIIKDVEPRQSFDSLDAVEIVMAIEERLGRSLSDEESERLTAEITERLSKGEFGDDELDDTLAIVVRKPGPYNPRGQAWDVRFALVSSRLGNIVRCLHS